MGVTLQDIEVSVESVAATSGMERHVALVTLEQRVFEVAHSDDRRLLAASASRVLSLLRLLRRREEVVDAAKVEVLEQHLIWAHTRSQVHAIRGHREPPAVGARESRSGTLRENVHSFVRSAQDPVRPVHIAEALDANLAAVSRALTQLEEVGAVEVTKVSGADGRGRWYSPAATASAARR